MQEQEGRRQQAAVTLGHVEGLLVISECRASAVGDLLHALYVFCCGAEARSPACATDLRKPWEEGITTLPD